MVKKYLSCIFLYMMLNIPVVHAVMTNVYCAVPDGSDWDWLLDSAGHYVLMEGSWGKHIYSDGAYFDYFSISIAKYTLLSSQCPRGYVAQPADRYSSHWEVFNIIFSDGSVIADGHKSIFSRINLPTAFRL